MRVEEELLVQVVQHVCTLTLNRPARANALTPELISRLLHAVVDAEHDPGVRVLVITGAGTRAFCAGGDLKARVASDAAGGAPQRLTKGVERFFLEAVLECVKPTIAAINGSAVAGGFELATACDLRIAAEGAQFGLPEAKRGMGAHFSTVMLPRVIPRAIAMEMLYTGEYRSAQQMLQCGFLNRVVPQEQVLAQALELAAQIADNAPVTLRRMKETEVKASGLPAAAALRLNEGANPYLSEDRKEGARAFTEQRPPQWSGR